ncbi:cysteine-rich receptor-like protein kinase 5 [Pistacia vera]|uniref:cysteine-rich receptor-like protein kinase 5 n=1 Tax=Pistacia vera TaxID=55513 RepID=UPI00126351E4|nr:cysteine-rich receptor-like protein kinase 5 [Pistacia vera]
MGIWLQSIENTDNSQSYLMFSALACYSWKSLVVKKTVIMKSKHKICYPMHGEIGMKGSFESDGSHLRVGSSSEMISCIHIGLFCVQENVANRPTMASIVLMLTSCYLCLLVPSKSKFFMQSNSEMDVSESPMLDRKENHVQFSLNEASMKIRTSTIKTDCT